MIKVYYIEDLGVYTFKKQWYDKDLEINGKLITNHSYNSEISTKEPIETIFAIQKNIKTVHYKNSKGDIISSEVFKEEEQNLKKMLLMIAMITN